MAMTNWKQLVYDYIKAYKELINDNTPIAVGTVADAIKNLKLISFNSSTDVIGSAYLKSDVTYTPIDIYREEKEKEISPNFPYIIPAGTLITNDYTINGSSGGGDNEDLTTEIQAQPDLVRQIRENLVGKVTGANATPQTILQGYSAYVGQKLVEGTYKPGQLDPSVFGYSKMATGVAISTSTNMLTIGHNLGERAKKIICYKVNPATTEDNSSVYNSEVISFIFDFDNRNGTNTTSQHFYGGTTSWYSGESTGFSAYVEYQDITTTKTTFRNYGATGYASGNVNPTFSKNTNYFWIAFI